MKNTPLKIALYGKGGIGKSTVAANLSVAFAKKNLKVLHIGCDPKGDSTRLLMGGKIPTVMEILQEIKTPNRDNYLYKGFMNIGCIEAGGPEPGRGCAGMAISTMMEELKYTDILQEHWDVEIYDVLGDVVCGGFSVPMRDNYVDAIYIVSSDEFMSIYAANNIIKSIRNFSSIEGPIFGGIIQNQRKEALGYDFLEVFAKKTNTSIVNKIPWAEEIVMSELEGKTLLEKYPHSENSLAFMKLADKIWNNREYTIPKALSSEEMEALSRELLKLKIENYSSK